MELHAISLYGIMRDIYCHNVQLNEKSKLQRNVHSFVKQTMTPLPQMHILYSVLYFYMSAYITNWFTLATSARREQDKGGKNNGKEKICLV